MTGDERRRPGAGSREAGRRRGERGASLAALMVAVGVMGLLMTVAAQQWSIIERREREKELIYRGTNIAAAIDEFRRQAQNQRLPTKLEDLTKGPRPTLRRVWEDPMTARYDRDGELVEGDEESGQPGQWELLTPSRNQPAAGAPGAGAGGRQGAGRQPSNSPINIEGITGVASTSEELSLAAWNDIPPGSPYTEWRFEVLNFNTRVAAVQQGQLPEELTLRPPGYGGDARAPGAPPPPNSPLGTGLTGLPASGRRP